MHWYLAVLKNYISFSGRARRKEFWMFTLISTLISLALTVVDVSLSGLPTDGSSAGTLSALYSLLVFIPSLGVSVRRMHDTGRSGLWLLVPIANVIFLCFDSQPHENGYGLDPKAAERHMPFMQGGMA